MNRLSMPNQRGEQPHLPVKTYNLHVLLFQWHIDDYSS